MTEQRLNDVHGRVVIKMFRRKDAPAIVWKQHERRAIRAAGFCSDCNLTDAAANGLNAGGAGMPNALDQIRRRRARTLLQQVSVITYRHRLAVVEAFHVANDLG